MDAGDESQLGKPSTGERENGDVVRLKGRHAELLCLGCDGVARRARPTSASGRDLSPEGSLFLVLARGGGALTLGKEQAKFFL
jgi:hypothetical protein